MGGYFSRIHPVTLYHWDFESTVSGCGTPAVVVVCDSGSRSKALLRNLSENLFGEKKELLLGHVDADSDPCLIQKLRLRGTPLPCVLFFHTGSVQPLTLAEPFLSSMSDNAVTEWVRSRLAAMSAAELDLVYFGQLTESLFENQHGCVMHKEELAAIDNFVSSFKTPDAAVAGSAKQQLTACAQLGEFPADSARMVIEALEMDSDAIFYDLFSGTGKFALQVTVQSTAQKIRGIEMSPSRNSHATKAIAEAQRWQARLQNSQGCADKLFERVEEMLTIIGQATADATPLEASDAEDSIQETPDNHDDPIEGQSVKGQNNNHQEKRLGFIEADATQPLYGDATHALLICNTSWPKAFTTAVLRTLASCPGLRRIVTTVPIAELTDEDLNRFQLEQTLVIPASWSTCAHAYVYSSKIVMLKS